MQKDIEELMKNKTDCAVFDEEIERIKNLINQLASSGKDISAPIVSSGANISTKELNDIRDAIKKVWEHEEKLKGFNLESILKKLKELKEDLEKKGDKKDIMRLEHEKAEKDHVDHEFKTVYREIEKLKDWCSRLEELLAASGKGSSTITDAQYGLLVKRVDRIEEKLA